jgi:hypothetical protein
VRPFARCLAIATALLAGVTLGGCGIPPTDLGADPVVAADLADDGTAVVCQRGSDGVNYSTVVDPDGARRPLTGTAPGACVVGVNAAGEAVGQVNGTPVVWDVHTGAVRSLPFPAGQLGAEVAAVNEQGLAVGRTILGAPGYPDPGTPAVWDLRAGTGPTRPPGLNVGGRAVLVSDRGVIVSNAADGGVWASDPATATATRVFSVAGPNSFTKGAVTGVNVGGEIVGWAPVAPPVVVVSYRWDPATATAGPVQPDGVSLFKVKAIDGDGRVVGSGRLASGAPIRALRYDRRDGSVVALDDDASMSSEPWAVNSHGHVLGITRGSDGHQVLRVWI